MTTEFGHYGVPGMKWGVRKSVESSGRAPVHGIKTAYKSYQDKFHKGSVGAITTKVVAKNGDVLTVTKEKPGPIALAVAKLTGANPKDAVSSMSITNKTGNRVGSFQVWRESETTVRGEWLEIKASEQGKGYSRAAIEGLLAAAKNDKKLKEARLQVPSSAAAAKHIYSTLGFTKDIDLGDTPTYGNIEDWVKRF